MPYDKPNISPPAIIKPFYQVAQENCAQNNPGNYPQPESPDMGGYAFFTNGTSGTSINYQVTFIPREGPIPEFELRRSHLAHLMETRPELRGTQ